MTTSRFVARNATDLLALVPIVIGFHPERSVVLLTFGAPGGAFHARVDLPVELAAQEEVADLLVGAAVTNQVRSAAVLVYSDDPASAGRQALLLLDGLLDNGVGVIDLVRVHDGRFFVIGEDDPGTDFDLDTHPFTAQRVLDGQLVHRNRAELVASLDGAHAPDRDRVREEAERWADVLVGRGRQGGLAPTMADEARWVQSVVRRVVGEGPPLTVEEAGRLLVLVGLVPVRDVAWSEMTRADARRHAGLWIDLVRRAPDDLLPGAAGLLAFAAWLAGDGALSWCALDRCLAHDPDYSMAHRISELLTAAVSPDQWEPVPESELPVFAPGLRAS